MLPMDRLLYLVWLLALCWSLGAAQSLKIKVRRAWFEGIVSLSFWCLHSKVVDEDGKVRRDFSDGSAAFQDRSYLLPDKQNGAIKVVPVSTLTVGLESPLFLCTGSVGSSGVPCSS